ncbi:MAG: hypothetical protein M1814_004664 [Vezdaea aestivalis]|nr:MAG: hypothetical protein M1814_004664 [Vezdaea aestivalis]
MGLSQKSKDILTNSIPPDLDIQELIASQDNFQPVPTVDASDHVYKNRPEDLAKFYHQHVVVGGRPLVLKDMHRLLDRNMYTPEWLRSDKFGATHEIARDLLKGEDVTMSVSHYLESLKVLQKQVDKLGYTNQSRQLLYMKDIECPQQWHDDLQVRLPPFLFYLNQNSSTEGLPAVPADLMSCLPPEMRAVNLQLYIGHEGTFTPTHRDMCGSLGQNLMVYASEQGYDKHIGCETPKGTSIWFMTEHKDRHIVAEYWRASLKQDIDMENHLATLEAWKNAPFTVYIFEQCIGDLVLVPSMSPHQVHNRAVTVKVAWNRTTVDTLEVAMREALLSSRLVCRSEQYKCRSITYYALHHYSYLLEHCRTLFSDGELDFDIDSPLKRNLSMIQDEFRRLFVVFEEIMLQEMFSDTISPPEKVQKMEYDGSLICSFCSCNMFNRFLTCSNCENDNDSGEPEPYDICMDCFSMGRSCKCISKFQWAEQFDWQELTSAYTIWRQQALTMGSTIQMDLPEDLVEIRKRTGKKSLAAVCQEQLEARGKRVKGIRPSQPEESGLVDGADQEEAPLSLLPDDINYSVTKVKHMVGGKLVSAFRAESVGCHCCKWPHAKWQQRKCSNDSCDQEYCYGVLWRAFDLLPLQVMEDPNWVCPKCLKICNCGTCRDRLGFTPHIPARATLGHKTLAAADSRSVETLIDFRKGNAHWLKILRGAVDTDTQGREKKLKKLQEDASKISHPADYSLVTNPHPHFHAPRSPSAERPIEQPPSTSLIDPALEVLDLTPGRHQPETLHERTSSNPHSHLASEQVQHSSPSQQRDKHISDNFTSLLYPQEDDHSQVQGDFEGLPDPQLEAQLQSQMTEYLHHPTAVAPYQTLEHGVTFQEHPSEALSVPKPKPKRRKTRGTERVVSDIKPRRTVARSRPEPTRRDRESTASKRKPAPHSVDDSELSEGAEVQFTSRAKPPRKRAKTDELPASVEVITTTPSLSDKASSPEFTDSTKLQSEAPGYDPSLHDSLPLGAQTNLPLRNTPNPKQQYFRSPQSSVSISDISAEESDKESNFSDTQPTSVRRKRESKRQRAAARQEKSPSVESSLESSLSQSSSPPTTASKSPLDPDAEVQSPRSKTKSHPTHKANFTILIPEMDPNAPKRGRGRPRKHALLSVASSTPPKAQEVSITTPRVSTAKRSRRKYQPREESVEKSPSSSPPNDPTPNFAHIKRSRLQEIAKEASTFKSSGRAKPARLSDLFSGSDRNKSSERDQEVEIEVGRGLKTTTVRAPKMQWTAINSPKAMSEEHKQGEDDDDDDDDEVEIPATAPVKRGRGRPRKYEKREPSAKKLRLSVQRGIAATTTRAATSQVTRSSSTQTPRTKAVVNRAASTQTDGPSASEPPSPTKGTLSTPQQLATDAAKAKGTNISKSAGSAVGRSRKTRGLDQVRPFKIYDSSSDGEGRKDELVAG